MLMTMLMTMMGWMDDEGGSVMSECECECECD